MFWKNIDLDVVLTMHISDVFVDNFKRIEKLQ